MTNTKKDNLNFSKYGKSFQEKLCMVILEDRVFADQIEEVLDINFLELNYLKVFLNKIFDYRKKYGVHPSRDIIKTILRSDLENENDLVKTQVREYYVRSQIADLSDQAYIKDTALDFCKKQNLKSAMLKSIGLLHLLMKSQKSLMMPLNWETSVMMGTIGLRISKRDSSPNLEIQFLPVGL